jgi:uncharacterized membrane protein
MQGYKELMDLVGTSIEVVGVLVIVAGAAVATIRLVFRRGVRSGEGYRTFRQDLIRTFLSMSLQLEIEGYWPWQRAEHLAAQEKESRNSRAGDA